MSLIKCPECGKEFSDRAKNCPHCNYSIRTKSKFFRSKVFFLVCVLTILFIVSLGYFLYYLNRPFYKLTKALKGGELITAQTIYDESVKKYNNQLDQAYDAISDYLPELVSEYAKSESDYNDVQEVFRFIEKNFPEIDIIKYDNNITEIYMSKRYYHMAEDMAKEKKFLNAIEAYQNVSEQDLEFYEESQEKIMECKKLYVSETQNQINSATEVDLKKIYTEITDEINSQSWLSDNKEIQDILIRVKEKVIQSILDEVNTFTEKGEYGKAIGLLYQNMEYDVDGILSDKMADVKQQRISE